MAPAEHVCPECSKSFLRKGDLTRHMRGIHCGERPHVCKDCRRAFAQASGLKTHKNVHTGLKPFVCGLDGCTKAFGDPSSCTRHRKETHRNTDAYNCPVRGCSSQIKRRSAFTAHLRKHNLNYDDVQIDGCGAKKRATRTRTSTTSGKRSDAKPEFFMPTPLPAHHGASNAHSSILYANHPHPSYSNTAYDSIYSDPLPNNLYSYTSSRVTTPGPASSSSSGSNSASCSTPEHQSIPQLSLSSYDNDNTMKMFTNSFDVWPLDASSNLYSEPYPFVTTQNRLANVY